MTVPDYAMKWLKKLSTLVWLLSGGVWSDSGVWKDNSTWEDS